MDSSYVLLKDVYNYGELRFYGIQGMTNILSQVKNDFHQIVLQEQNNFSSNVLANLSELVAIGKKSWNFANDSFETDLKFNNVSNNFLTSYSKEAFRHFLRSEKKVGFP